MGKTGKWLKSFLTGKKIDKEHSTTNYQNQIISFASSENPPNSVPIPKEKKRWSFRRSSASAAKDSNPPESNVGTPPVMTMTFDIDMEQEKHAMAVAAATAAAVAAAQAAAAIIRMTAVVTASNGKHIIIEEAAAVKIQSVFRSYLARKALCALKGLVKLQAMVRGHLVRKRAADTLRCMQALVTAQTRARTQRIKMAEDSYSNSNPHNHWQPSIHRKSFQENRLRNPHQEIEREMEENIKIVEMDQGEASKKTQNTYKSSNQTENYNFSASPAPSALTEMSPISYSNHFEDYSNITSPHSHSHYYSSISKPNPSHIPFEFPKSEYAESLPYDYPLNFPNYMANTESSKAKVRSQSAPKARPDALERQPSRRRVSVEGRNIPRAVRMQRSSSHLGSSAGQRELFMWPVKLDRSSVSLKDSECGSSCSVATNLNYCRSSIVAAHDAHGSRC